MTILSLADCCRHLSIDPKTLRFWLAQAPFTRQPHPQDARLKGLTEEQLRWLAQAHHRHLATLPQEPSLAAPPTPIASPTLPEDLRELLQALRALPAQLVALQEQVADLSQGLSQGTGPSATARSRSGATTRAAGHRQSRGRSPAESLRQQRRPSQAQVLALVEYAGEGRYVVISPRGGLLPFEPESPAWFAWLTTCSSFRFVGKSGRLTAHRELHNPSRAVWRAHRNIRNHTYNVRLGKTEQLSIAALEQAAAALHAHL
jgi:transposase-like protein